MILFFGSIAGFSQQSGKLLYEQGLEAFKSKNYGSAELIFRKVVESDDQYKDSAWYYMAISIFYQKKYKSAVFELNRFLLICSSAELCNKSRYWIAECYYYQNDYSTAVEEYKRFISANKNIYPEMIKESYLKLGKIYFIQQRYAEAINEYDNAVKYAAVKSEIEELNLLIAETFYADKNYLSAVQYLDKSILSKDKATRSKAYLLQGRINFEQKSYQSALESFNRIDKDFQNEESYISAFYYKALCFEKIKDINNAIVSYDNFIKLSQKGNEYYDARFRRAILYKSVNFSESLAEMKQIYNETNSSDIKQKAAIELALFEFENGNKTAAINYLKNISIELNDSNKETILMLGDVYMQIGEFEQAEKIFSSILDKYRFDKDADRYQFYYALVFLNKGDYVKAAQNFEKIRELNPFSIYINESIFYISKAEYENKNYQKAANLLNQYLAIRTIEFRFEAMKSLHLTYIQLDDKTRADNAIALLVKSYMRSDDLSVNIYNHLEFLKKRKASSLYYENLLISTYPRSKFSAFVFKDRAENAFKEKNFRLAEQNYTAYLEIIGNNADLESFVKKAQSIYAQKNYEKTIYYLQNEKLSVYNADAFFNILLLLAKSYYNTGEYNKSYEYFSQIRDQKFQDEDNFILFDVYVKRKLLSKALEVMAQLENNKQFYPECLYIIASYHKNYNEYEEALRYLDVLEKEFPGNYYEDLAIYEKADIDYKIENTDEAVKKILRIKNVKLKVKGDILLSLIYLKTGKLNDASKIVNKNILSFVKVPEGEFLLKSLIEFSYNNKDINSITTYSGYLVKNYNGNVIYSDYYKAKYYFDVKNFQRSFGLYTNVSKVESQYSDEAFYYLGEISLYFYRKNAQAIDMYAKVSKNSNELYMKSRINLAMLYFESGKVDECRQILNELRQLDKSIKYQKQAENLYEQYSLNSTI